MKEIPEDDTVQFRDTVYHVGDLDKERQKPDYSFEGQALSVSVHPREWADIARLGGDTYELYKEEGVFLDAIETDSERIREWCIANGFVKPCSAYEARNELDSNSGYTMHYDRKDAEGEAQPPSNVIEVESVELDERGVEYWEEAFTKPVGSISGPIGVRELLPLWYAEAQGYDGVWWQYDYEPQNLSCPCGGIFQSKLDSWTVTLKPNR